MQINATCWDLHLFSMDNEERNWDWVEVSLLLKGELAEPVAALLADYVDDGVVLERVEKPQGKDGLQEAVRVYGYLPVDGRLEERKERIQRALWHLGQIQDLPRPAFRPVQREDWRTAWQKNYRPIRLGKRLIVVPAWMDSPDPDREAIFISPGMAFGSGTHPSTQLSLTLVDEVLDRQQGVPRAMIDIGCGSGILSIAAARLGVPYVLGLDTDEGAVRVAQSNLLENQLQNQVEFRQGSVPALIQGQFPLQRAPLVCANIIAPVLGQLFEEGLAEVVAPGGELILSGMLASQAAALQAALQARGMEIVSRVQDGDWVALRGRKPAS